MINLSLNSFSNIDIDQLLKLLKNYAVDNLELSTAFSLKYLNGLDRFASVDFINLFNKKLKENNIKTSIHLFGELAKIIGNESIPNNIINLINWDLIDRIQLNRYSVNIDIALENLSKLNFSGRLILPVNKKDFDIIEFPLDDKVDWLYDCSHGKGIEINSYPIDPLINRQGKIGFAGGINENNILKLNNEILALGFKNYYLDIESGIRENDRISFEKIKNILEIIVIKNC
jgi:hypothetical protein